MQEVSQYLSKIIALSIPFLETLTDQAASIKPMPNKWSKKEIIGHLIDSACNNQQKFVRTMAAKPHLDFVGYDQNHWVNAQQYNQINWQDLLKIWQGYNLQIAHILAIVPENLLQNTITIEGQGPFTLAFIMEDYPAHLVHHLKQILPELNLQTNFINVYNA